MLKLLKCENTHTHTHIYIYNIKELKDSNPRSY